MKNARFAHLQSLDFHPSSSKWTTMHVWHNRYNRYFNQSIFMLRQKKVHEIQKRNSSINLWTFPFNATSHAYEKVGFLKIYHNISQIMHDMNGYQTTVSVTRQSLGLRKYNNPWHFCFLFLLLYWDRQSASTGYSEIGYTVRKEFVNCKFLTMTICFYCKY